MPSRLSVFVSNKLEVRVFEGDFQVPTVLVPVFHHERFESGVEPSRVSHFAALAVSLDDDAFPPVAAHFGQLGVVKINQLAGVSRRVAKVDFLVSGCSLWAKDPDTATG